MTDEEIVRLLKRKPGETEHEKWIRLKQLSDSRWHLPDDGPCYAALGQRGCPCCDAREALANCVDDMLDEIARLKSEKEPSK